MTAEAAPQQSVPPVVVAIRGLTASGFEAYVCQAERCTALNDTPLAAKDHYRVAHMVQPALPPGELTPLVRAPLSHKNRWGEPTGDGVIERGDTVRCSGIPAEQATTGIVIGVDLDPEGRVNWVTIAMTTFKADTPGAPSTTWGWIEEFSPARLDIVKKRRT